MIKKDSDLHILGGGPAGMALSYFALNKHIPFKLIEATNQVGGNCKTISEGEFKFDTGAHRLHDKDKEVTKLIKNILKDDLLKVSAPSQIFLKGKMIDFPLNINSVFKQLSWVELKKIMSENILKKFLRFKTPSNFKDFVNKKYGETLSNLFLINYTEKLWGENAGLLSVKVSGDRLRNLHLTSLIKGYILGDNFKPKHLEGSFYYPRNGFGTIFESIKDMISKKNILFNSPITEIFHENKIINSISIGDKKNINVKNILSTLPLNYVLRILNPKPPEEIQEIINNFKFRSVRLCVLFLNRKKFSNNASIYFPDNMFPFTRIYEPKNRSSDMSPKDKTCIVLEVPCNKNDMIFNYSEEKFFDIIEKTLIENKFLSHGDIFHKDSMRIPYAYPVLKVGVEDKIKKALKYLNSFKNLNVLGRNANFEYVHIHNLFRDAKILINQLNG
jgi:protoporphyrinogen oxidase